MNCTKKNLHHVGGDWGFVPNDTKILKIDFTGNQIPTLEAVPPAEAQLSIVLSRCSITYLRPLLFSEAKNVKFVDLSYNNLKAEQLTSDRFKGPYKDETNEPIALEHLDLSYNQIHSLAKGVFEGTPNLKSLNLEGNDFRLVDVHTQLALSSVRSLESLNLGNNELTELIVTAIDSHENLTKLDLSTNLLDFVPESLPHIGRSLEVLKIDNNPIIELVFDSFVGLGNLMELSANNLTKLKYINSSTFAPMTRLKKLSLCNNSHLIAIDQKAFGDDPTLEEFYLINNSLHHINYELLPWKKLRVFEFNENPLDCSCDLYNISTTLSKDTLASCLDPRNDSYVPVSSLHSDICLYKPVLHSQWFKIRIGLTVLGVFVVVLLTVISIRRFVRYRRYHRSRLNYSENSQVNYKSVPTNPHSIEPK